MCSICNFISSQKAGFKTHMESVHENKSFDMNSSTLFLHINCIKFGKCMDVPFCWMNNIFKAKYSTSAKVLLCFLNLNWNSIRASRLYKSRVIYELSLWMNNCTQCFFRSLNTKRNSRFQFYIPGIQNHLSYPKQKEFLKSYEGNLK